MGNAPSSLPNSYLPRHTPMSKPTRILILGGGFGGLSQKSTSTNANCAPAIVRFRKWRADTTTPQQGTQTHETEAAVPIGLSEKRGVSPVEQKFCKLLCE